MGRPRIDLSVRYAEVIAIWRAADAQGGEIAYRCDSPNKAIHIMHRLNMARSALRDEGGRGVHPWDALVVRNKENFVTISRKDSLDMSRFCKLDGTEIPAETIEQILNERAPTIAEARAAVDREGLSPEMRDFEEQMKRLDREEEEQKRTLHKIKEADPTIPNAQKLHFDPTKPLLEDC